MSSLERILHVLNEKCQSYIGECVLKNNIVYSWLEEFSQDAKEQVLNINQRAWVDVPKTPSTKNKTRSRISKLRTSSQSSKLTTQPDDQVPSTSRTNTEVAFSSSGTETEEASQNISNTDEERSSMPPPPRTSRRASKRVANSTLLQSTRSSKRLAVPKVKPSMSTRKNKKRSQSKISRSSVCLQVDSVTDDDSELAKSKKESLSPSKTENSTVVKPTLNEVREQDEGEKFPSSSTMYTEPCSQARAEVSQIVSKAHQNTMPPPLPRSFRQSSRRIVDSSLHQSNDSSKLILFPETRITMSTRESSQALSLRLDSGSSTGNDSETAKGRANTVPKDNALPIAESSMLGNRIISEKQSNVLSESDKANINRKTQVIDTFSGPKVPLPIIDMIQVENIKKEHPIPNKQLMNIPFVILDSDSEVDTPPPKRNCVVSKQHQENGETTEYVLSKETQQTETPLALTNLHNVKRSLHKNLLAISKTPQSPKQLFSAYTKGDVKIRTQAFENFSASNHESVASVKETTPLRSNVRRSVRRSIVNADSLILAKSSRMSTTARRSSIMRYRRSVLMNKCARKLSANKENLSEMQGVGYSDEEKEGATQTVPEASAEEMLEVGSSEKDEGSEKEESSPDELPKTDEAVTLEKVTKNNASAIQSLQLLNTLPSTSKLVLDTTSALTMKKAMKKFGSGSSLSKLVSEAVPAKRNYPISETRVFQKSKVAEMVSIFDKGGTSKCSSASKAQGHLTRLGPNQTLLASGYKNFQKPSYAICAKVKQSLLAEEIEKKRSKEEELLKKREKMLRERMEEVKRRNEEKQQRVKENRLKEKQATENLRRTMEKQEQNHLLTKKALEEKRKELIEAKRLQRLKREAEKRKREEEALVARQRELEWEQAELKRQQQLRKEAEAREALQKMKAPPKAIQKVNLNQTYTADQSTDANNYDITPHRSELPKEELKDSNNYDIDDLRSGDETDDECDPRKKIPDWAQGVSLRIAIIHQHRNPLNVDEIFPPVDTCALEKLFKVQRSRFYHRTSSAVWHDAPGFL